MFESRATSQFPTGSAGVVGFIWLQYDVFSSVIFVPYVEEVERLSSMVRRLFEMLFDDFM